MVDFNNIGGFDWDHGNTHKIANKHNVVPSEAEQIFFNEPLLLLGGLKHSQDEPRFHALGMTDDRRLLHVTFTLRAQSTLIRIISARDMHRKERKFMTKSKQLPEFSSEDEERAFWETNDSTEYLDWTKAKTARFPNLKPSTKTISLRLPESLLDRIKIEANKRDMPYQSLIKAWLVEDVEEQRRR